MSTEQPEHNDDALEDSEDVRAFDAALAEEGDNVPWEQVKAELGFT